MLKLQKSVNYGNNLNSWINKIPERIYWLIPLLQFHLVELFTQRIEMFSAALILNVCIYYGAFLSVLFLTKRKGVTTLITTIFWGIAGFANAMLLQFRQTPVLPWDLLSVNTALDVSGKYHLNFTSRFILVIIAFLILISIGCATLNDKINIKGVKRVGLSVLSVFLTVIISFTCQLPNLRNYIPFNDSTFYMDAYYSQNGFAFSFLRMLGSNKIEKPDGYDTAAVQEELTDNTVVQGSNNPNIIVIMNESLSDLTVLNKNLKTNQKLLPYINSLSKNTVRGNVVCSVKGGNTANSEFEFLTSLPTAFTPRGSIPYQQFINKQTTSLISFLNERNYDTYSFHPAAKSNWQRDRVYPLLGFKNICFEEEMKKNLIQNPLLIRGVISDRTTYDYVIRDFENRDKTKGFFEFCITLQNHGGYENPTSFGYAPDVHAEGIKSDELSTYLSLANESDRAFKYITDYFSKIKEPTIILMFGDHQPASNVTDLVKADDCSQLDEYKTPYVLWANYDIDTKNEYNEISINYLPLLLLEKCNIPLNNFYKQIKSVYTAYPVTSVMGIQNNIGKLSSFAEIKTEKHIENYRKILYYNLVEKQ